MLPFALRLELIAIQERKELIKAVIDATNKAVKYEHGLTPCPVCELIGVRSVLLVKSTQDNIRYCLCPECGATPKAIGEIRITETKTEAKRQVYKESRSKKKKGRKNGNNS